MKVVNLFAGPGAGKSTTAAGLFHLLKLKGLNVELVTEFAKDLTWEKRHNALDCQAYVFGKQLHRMERLRGQVDVVVTDSPLLLGSTYAPPDYPMSWHAFVVWVFGTFENINIFLSRTKPYTPVGRNQTEEQAHDIDETIKSHLRTASYGYTTMDGDAKAPSRIMEIYFR